MTPGQGGQGGREQGGSAGAWVPGRDAEARLELIRQALATTTEAQARARLRGRLADQLAAMGDIPGAVGELRQALAEAPPSAGLWFGARSVGRHLTVEDAEELFAAVRQRRRGANPSVAGVLSPGGPKSKGATAPGGRGQPAPSAPAASSQRASEVLAPSPPVPVLPDALTPPPALRREPVPVLSLIEQAFAALSCGKIVRARRLGEEAIRGMTVEVRDEGPIRNLIGALQEAAGGEREGLRLTRTLIEARGDRPTTQSSPGEELRVLIQHATDVGMTDLAARWSRDLAPAFTVMLAATAKPSVSSEGTQTIVSLRYREAQRLALTALSDPSHRADAMAKLRPLLGGHAGGDAALRIAERLAAAGKGAASPGSLPEMLEAAFETERSGRRRQRLAARWAEALAEGGDAPGALAVLGRAIDMLPREMTTALRRQRLDLLRTTDRRADLCRALAADAELADLPQRRSMRAEHAHLLDEAGEPDAALEVRLRGLREEPGALLFLGPARQRLESEGRLDESLDLVTAALAHVLDAAARARLLQDLATLAEVHAGDRERAAAAWLEVLSLIPGAGAAFEAAERLLRQLGQWDRLGALLATEAARDAEPVARARMLWRLAEFRRVDRQAPLTALPLYRQIVALGLTNAAGLSFPEDEWQRRDDALALQTARALAAPDATEAARALGERASLLLAADRWEEADRALERALDLNPAVPEVLAPLQRFHQQRGDIAGLKRRLTVRAERVTGAAAAPLWVAMGQANQSLGDLAAAAADYGRALAADAGSPAPLRRLRELAVSRGDFAGAVPLFEKEIALARTAAERTTLSIELAALLSTRLEGGARAIEILEAALVSEPGNATALDALFTVGLAAGAWEKAQHALEGMLAAGLALADTSQRYYRLGLAAEKTGQVDRALTLYSRSYARNPAFRPTLERLSDICFELQQWENAWKATEHLIERHGAELDGERRADLALRSAWADLHVAQRQVAANRIAAMMAGPASQVGVRDVAESWASMRFEPRLLGGVDGDRRARVFSRLTEVLALTKKNVDYPARALARETLAALALVDRRWADALSALDALGGDATLDDRRRCLFVVTAGDVSLHKQGDAVAATLRYQRARVLNPREPRLARVEVATVGAGRDRQGAEEGADEPTPAPIRGP